VSAGPEGDVARALNRVRKMLALGRDAGATEGERDNALRAAYATMAKYNLDMLEVDAAKAEDDPRAESRETFLGLPWCQRISHAVAELLFCKYVVSNKHNGGRYDKAHAFIGKRSNALTAIELSRYLCDSVHREAVRAQRAAGEGYPFYRSFGLGAAARIRERCRALRADGLLPKGRPRPPGTALVLASLYERERLANDAVTASIYPVLGRARGGKRTVLGEAHDAGKRYGGALSLSADRKRMLGGRS
jgi:hypothetical protein